MRILHVGIFKDHELGGDIVLRKGFEANGVRITEFDYRTLESKIGREAMIGELLEKADGHEMVFIGKGESIGNGPLAILKKRGIKISLWYGDMRQEPEGWLMSMLPYVDCFFMTSGGNTLKQYHTVGKPKRSAFFLNPSDPDLVSRKSTKAISNSIDVLFTGSNYHFAGTERYNVVKYLKTRKDVTFYGGAEQPARRGYLFQKAREFLGGARETGSRTIRGDEYISAIRSAKVGIGVNGFQNVDKYTSDRLVHYAEFGTFYLSWMFPGIERMFSYGREIVCFNSISDLESKIEYYLVNEQERKEIAERCQRRMLEEYNTKNVTRYMLEVIEKGASSAFEWAEVLD